MNRKTSLVLFFLVLPIMALGQDKKNEPEWNFLFSSLWGKKNYNGVAFIKSNAAKTKYAGIALYRDTRPEKSKSEKEFSLKQEIKTTINGQEIIDTLKINGIEKRETFKSKLVLDVDFRFLPEKFQIRKNVYHYVNFRGGILFGGGGEFSIAIKSTNSKLLLGADGKNTTIEAPSVPSLTLRYMPYVTYGIFSDISRLTLFFGGKTAGNFKKRESFWNLSLGLKF